MKKRILAVLAIVAMVSCFTGCGDSDSKETTNKTETSSTSKYYFEDAGKYAHIGDNGDDAIKALGEPKSTFTAVSCAFEGEDHMYLYDAYQVTVSTVDGKDIVTAITLTSDMASTMEGVKIGSSEADVMSKYSVDKVDSGNYQIKDGNTTIAIVVKDDSVISINYTYNK